MATLVEGDSNTPFLIATTPRCREGTTPFPRLFHFTLDLYLIMLSVKQGGIKYHFLILWYNSTWAIGKHSNHHANVLGWVIPKTKKLVLDAALLNTKVRIKGKVEQSREGVVPSPTPRCSSYWKRSFQVILD